jgi:hypothetical protein
MIFWSRCAHEAGRFYRRSREYWVARSSLARAIVLTNQKGAVLELSGQQVGLMANADLSGLAITLK